MTPEELKEIKERAEKATPGPWSRNAANVNTKWNERITSTWTFPPNAEFIAHARTDIPKLLDEVERLKALLAEQLKFCKDEQINSISPKFNQFAKLQQERDALKAENEDLKVINEVLTNHSAKLESKLRSRIAKFRDAIEKIGYWKSDARVCYFPVDCYELLAQDDDERGK